MAVPTPTFGPNGFITPSEPDILVAVKEEINAAFGGNLNMADETPQGQLAVSQAAAIGNANDIFVFLTQMFDPAYSFGRYQDALARLYYLERIPSQPTVVQATCIGLAGVVIPDGSLAQDEVGVMYASVGDAVIGSDGTASIPFACTVPGPVPCPANTLTVIYQAIPGWDSINNPGEGVLGRLTESRQEFEARRYASVANNSVGMLPSIRGKVLQVPGVLDCYVTENVEDTSQTVNGVTLNPKSLYVAVVGGSDDEVAQTIWRKKSPGCSYNGNTTVTVYDTNSGYQPPLPAYSVAFERPASLPIIFKIDIQDNPLILANSTELIQAAIIAAFAGSDGGARASIGAELFASRYTPPILALGPWAQLRSIKIGSPQAPDAVVTGSITDLLMTVTAITSGPIEIGGTVFGDEVADGTVITSQASGTPGGVGTYNVNVSQTVTSTTLTTASATLDTLVPFINVAPTITAENIQVTYS